MNTGDARTEIMCSIRANLALSPGDKAHENNSVSFDLLKSPVQTTVGSLVEEFKRNLEAVDGHCIIARNELEIEAALTRITEGKRITSSDAPPSAQDLFNVDVGITRAQAGIAETGTLVLDSAAEQNRLVSLVPPVHIALLDAAKIYATLGETLAMLQRGNELSPAITFITGPSRTADIELTLTVGVHGPQELHVIIVHDKHTSEPLNQ